MGWQFWKRNTDDPLAKLFFKKYRLNLLSIPREKVSLCDVYTGDADGHQKLLASPGSIKNFLEPQFEIPSTSIVIDDQMSDIYDTTSNSISANVALDFLEGFLKALGGQFFNTNIRSMYEHKGTRFIELRFDAATQDRIDRYALGDKLRGHKIATGNTAIIPGRSYYIVTAIVRSNSISISARAESQKDVDIKAEVDSILGGSVSISQGTSRESETKFKGDKKLALGLELSELTYDTQYQQLRLDPVIEEFRVRGKKNTLRTREVIKSSFIGDPKEGDMFVDLL